jgi:hypothetical protein
MPLPRFFAFRRAAVCFRADAATLDDILPMKIVHFHYYGEQIAAAFIPAIDTPPPQTPPPLRR